MLRMRFPASIQYRPLRQYCTRQIIRSRDLPRPILAAGIPTPAMQQTQTDRCRHGICSLATNRHPNNAGIRHEKSFTSNTSPEEQNHDHGERSLAKIIRLPGKQCALRIPQRNGERRARSSISGQERKRPLRCAGVMAGEIIDMDADVRKPSVPENICRKGIASGVLHLRHRMT